MDSGNITLCSIPGSGEMFKRAERLGNRLLQSTITSNFQRMRYVSVAMLQVSGTGDDASARFINALCRIEHASGRYVPGTLLLAQSPIDLTR